MAIKNNIIFHLVMNIFVVLFITGASYYHIPFNGFKDKCIYFVHLLLLQSSVAGFLYFISINKIIFKIVFPTLYIGYGIIAFYIYSLDITLSKSLINVVFQTKFYIAKDLISFQLLLYILTLIFSLYFILFFYKKIKTTKSFIYFSLISLVLIFIYPLVGGYRKGKFNSRLPYSLVKSINDYLKPSKTQLKTPLLNTYTSSVDSMNVVLIIGETVRADHLGINGYYRNTTPNLSRNRNVISFKNIYTSNTNTYSSVPQILTSLNLNDFTKTDVQSLFSVLNSLDINTCWLGNQLLETSYETIVNTNKKVKIIDNFKSNISFHKLKDKSLLPFLSEELIVQDSKNLFSLHMIGSHWWYESRYEERHRKFIPVIDSKYIPSLSNEQIINSYDNTILYLDDFFNDLINIVNNQKKPSIIFYISDHGEALGENGKWLHANKEEPIKNPAMLIWYSDLFEEIYPLKIEALKAMKDQSFTTDVVYHSILALFEINEFDKEKSIFYCENK